MNIERLVVAAAITVLLAPFSIRGQQPPTATTQPQPMFDDSIEAADQEMPKPDPERKLIRWNEYDGKWATLKFGAATMLDGAAFAQDEDSEAQLGELSPAYKVRDFRLLFSGRFPRWKRDVTWKTGVMYDGPSHDWLVRETGLIVAVPEISGHLFLGRTKEGTSLTKQMVGFAVWGLERSPMHDAAIPIMADGIRWMGYRPQRHLVWNLGFFNQTFTNSRTFPYYDRQIVARVGYLPYVNEKDGKLVHIGLNVRYGDPYQNELHFKARPEANPAPYYIDTGKFPAKHTTLMGPEFYYRNGRLLLGSEYYFMKVDSEQTGNPVFHGGDVVATWLFTGETRAYSTKGAVFGFLKTNTSVFQGGRGAWEGIFRISYIDADSGTLEGGKNFRVSPLIAWHLNDEIRWTFGYGFDILDRFGDTGVSHIIQTRISLMF